MYLYGCTFGGELCNTSCFSSDACSFVECGTEYDYAALCDKLFFTKPERCASLGSVLVPGSGFIFRVIHIHWMIPCGHDRKLETVDREHFWACHCLPNSSANCA